MYKTVFILKVVRYQLKVEGSVGVILAYNRPIAKVKIKLSGPQRLLLSKDIARTTVS
jgi:hypothetical protein